MKAVPLLLAALVLAAPAAFAEETVSVTAGQSRTLLVTGLTAAYGVDGTIAEASARNGVVTISGRGAGTTRVVIVTMEETRAVNVTVVARPLFTPVVTSDARPPAATAETRYVSSTRQVTSTIDLSRGDSSRRTEIHAMNVRTVGAQAYGVRTAFPSASYSIVTPRQRLTFLDAAVESSPLTLSRTNVRGFHLERDAWRFHAGYTGAAFYDGLVLPARRETVFGASYIFNAAPSLRLMPSLYLFPSRNTAARDRRGAVASLLADYGDDERLRVRGELGVSRGVGGALQLSMNRGEQRLRADLRYEPRRFAGAGPADLHGLYSDLSWSGRPSQRITAIAAASVNHFMLPNLEQRSVTSNAEVRFRATGALSLIGGASFGDFQPIVPRAQHVRSLIVPGGIALDFARGSLTALGRFGDSSSSASASRGFRLSGRTSLAGFSAAAYYDRQTDAPALQLIFRERPDLALALEQLGLTAESPQDIARLLRDNAALINLGFIEGATVDLSLLKTQAGLDLAWLSSGPAREQLRLRLLHSRTERVAFATTTDIATLSFSRRLGGATDLTALLAVWTTVTGRVRTRDRSIDIGVRKRFEEMPGFGGGSISGTVFGDDEMRGEWWAEARGLGGVEVQLDGARSATTDARGRYAFSAVGKGIHRVAVRLPSPTAYFTTTSHAEIAAGESADFGLANTPARLIGQVTSDAGLGVAGVVIALSRGERRITATSDSDGRFAIAAPPGEWTAGLERESLPEGYVLIAVDPQMASLVRANPVTLHFSVNALRTISGVARPGEVEVVELHRRVTTDPQGRFVIRSMPAGDFTLSAGKASVKISVSGGPVTIKDVVIGAHASPGPSSAAERSTGGLTRRNRP